GGKPISYIASWDGTKWDSLGNSVNDYLNAIVVDENDNVIAGGGFYQAGGKPISYIASWDGTKWDSLGSDVNSTVTSLEYNEDGILYAGGYFTEAGGDTVNNIASWYDSTWHDLNGGTTSSITCLEAIGCRIYIGGYFQYVSSDSINARYIASWNGLQWDTLAAGMTDYYEPLALASSSQNELFVGGEFRENSYKSANFIGKWHKPFKVDTILGDLNVIIDSSKNYSVNSLPEATGYNWTVPNDWTITSGQNTTDITVDVGSTAGNRKVCVAPVDSCKTGSKHCEKVKVTTSIDEEESKNFISRIQPNPFKKQGFIHIDNEKLLNKNKLKLEVTDLTGKVITERNETEISDGKIVLKGNRYEAGTYFYGVWKGEELVGRGKFIVLP
ncbi:MAG: T9SS type A sorting domain-containing protein, partial [Flavobacteriales bacterium]